MGKFGSDGSGGLVMVGLVDKRFGGMACVGLGIGNRIVKSKGVFKRHFQHGRGMGCGFYGSG